MIKNFIYYIKKIDKSYRELFLDKSLLIRATQGIMIILSEGFCFLSIYIVFLRFLQNKVDFLVNNFIKAVLIVIIYILVHYAIGFILLLSSNMHLFMYKSEENSIKADFLLSYFITSTYVLVMLLFPDELITYEVTGILGVTICYVLNMKILFTVMKRPDCIKFSMRDDTSFTKVILAALLLVALIVINLFLGVCLVNALGDMAYSNNPTKFDLLYYTIVTFTTIGFGDISPITTPAKIMAIVISVTSIICVTIFLGSIFSFRDKFN